MSRISVHKENYRKWRIEVYESPTGINKIEFSCYNPRGENVDHLKNPDFLKHMNGVEYAIENARRFVDRLISESQKTYQLWQIVPGKKDLPVGNPCVGTLDEALRVFDPLMPGWRTLNRFYMTENGQKVIP